MQERPGIIAPDGENNDLKNLQAINEDGCPLQHLIVMGRISAVTAAKENRQYGHDHDQTGNKGQMLPGKITLSRPLIAVQS
jgi:hypothetical protein